MWCRRDMHSCVLKKIKIYFFFQAEDGIRDSPVTGVQTCALPILNSDRPVVNFDLTGESHELPMLGGNYNAMTFSGQIPGPTLRVTQGDVVHMTLTIPSDEPTQHGNDMHASQMSAVPYMGAVNIGETGEYCYIAEVPGVYKYHCSGVNEIGRASCRERV